MRNVIVIIFALISACATTPKPVADNHLEGIWLGRWIHLNNSTGDAQISMVNNQYTVDYPSMRCGGTLTLISHDNRKIEFRQNMTYGLSNCPAGRDTDRMVITTTGENRAKVEWYTQWGLVWWVRKIGTGEFSRLTSEQEKTFQLRKKMEEPVEAKFLAWSRQWSIDNYIPLSAKIDETGTPGKETLVRGTFRFERFGSINKIPFSARLGTVPGGGFTVADLCYNDSSSGMMDCTNSDSGNAGLYKLMSAVLVGGVAAAIIGAAGSGDSSSEKDNAIRNRQLQENVEGQRKILEDQRRWCVEGGGTTC